MQILRTGPIQPHVRHSVQSHGFFSKHAHFRKFGSKVFATKNSGEGGPEGAHVTCRAATVVTRGRAIAT